MHGTAADGEGRVSAVHAVWETMHGSVHRGTGAYNRDHLGLRVVAGTVLVLAAADGRGVWDARRGHLGARWAVEELMRCAVPFARRVAETEDDADCWPSLIEQAGRLRGEICRSWRERARTHEANGPSGGVPWGASSVDPETLANYGSTVLGAVLSGRLLFCWQLGGGDISLVGEYGTRVLFNEWPGVPASLCVARPGLLMRFHWQPVEAIGPRRLVLLNTDGLSRAFADRRAYRAFVEGLYARAVHHDVQAVRDGLDGWLERAAGRSGDDTSLVAAYIGR